MKKTLTYIITVIALTLLFTVSVSAYDQGAYDAMYAGLYAAEDEIDLSAYSLSADEIAELFNRIIHTSPELFYVDGGYEYSYADGGQVLALHPNYTMPLGEIASARSTYQSFVSSLTAGVKSSWTELEKALYLHDQLVIRMEYSLSNADVYSFAKTGKGNCTAYSLSYIAACEAVGIECDVAISESMKHMWNVIKIGGQWYHVDVTWDDPTPNLYGRAMHNNFLKSDSAIKTASTSPHSGWVSEYSCTSTLYDSACWNDVKAPFVYAGGAWYSINNSTRSLAKFNVNSSSVTDLVAISDYWPVIGSASVYTDAYSGVGVYGDCVYYNSPAEIFSYNVKTGAVSSVYTLTTDAFVGTGSIYYITVSGNKLTYYLASAPTATQPSSGTLTLAENSGSEYTVTYTVNGEAVATQQYKAGAAITPPALGKIDGYIFKGWENLPATMPAENITVTAILEVCPHEDAENVVVTEASCTSDGVGNVVCTDCDHVISTYEIKGGHGFGDWKTITEADCETDGLRRRHCPKCGEITEEEVIPAYDAHHFDEWTIVTEATEDKAGTRTRTCTRCGFVDTQEYILNIDTSDDTSTDTTEADTSTDTTSTDSDSGEATTDSESTTDEETEKTDSASDGTGIKDFFVYFTIIVIVIACGVGIYLAFVFGFGKKK